MITEWPGNELKICRFVRAHYAPWSNAPLVDLFKYFKWFAIMNLLGVVMHEEEVIAVGTCRFFHYSNQYRTEFLHDPAGRYIRINLYGALCPAAIVVLGGRLARTHNVRGCTLLWHRDPEELGPPRQYSIERWQRLMRSLLYVQRERTNTTEPNSVCAS